MRETEREREMRGKEAEGYKKQAEKTKQETEQFWSHAETLETFLREIRLQRPTLVLNKMYN